MENKTLFSFHHYHFVALACMFCLRQSQRKKVKHTYLDTHICTGSTHLINSLRQKYLSNQKAVHFPPHAAHLLLQSVFFLSPLWKHVCQ